MDEFDYKFERNCVIHSDYFTLVPIYIATLRLGR